MKSKLTLGIALVAVVIAALAFLKSPVQSPAPVVGAESGPTHTNAQEFLAGLTQGFVNATSSSVATYTLVAGDLVRQGAFYDTIQFEKTGAVATTTWTLVASSSLSNVLPLPGQRASICFSVATSTGFPGLALAEGTGWDIVAASSTAVVTGAGSRTVYGGTASCGQVIRQKQAASNLAGNLLLVLTATTPAQ